MLANGNLLVSAVKLVNFERITFSFVGVTCSFDAVTCSFDAVTEMTKTIFYKHNVSGN